MEKHSIYNKLWLYGGSWKGIRSRFASNGDANSSGSLKPYQIEKSEILSENILQTDYLNSLNRVRIFNIG